jgi:hypothetical protein
MKALDDAIAGALESAGAWAALATGGLFKVLAPERDEGDNSPFQTFQCVSAPDDYTLTQRATITLTYLFKSYADGYDWTTPQQINERTDAVLTDGSLSISGYRLLRARRANHFDTDDNLEGKHYAVSVAYFVFQVAPN